MKNLSIGEFYSGPGGLGMGAKLAKIKDKKGNLKYRRALYYIKSSQ